MPLLIELPEAGLKLRSKFSNQPFAENTFLKPTTLGDFVSNGFAVNDQFPSTLDGDPVVRTYNNLTINTGHIVTPVNRCKGMYLFIDGDLVINGILSMTARGANAPGKFIGIDPIGERVYFNEEDIFSQYNIFKIAKEGGKISPFIPNSAGVNGVNNACGSGGSGHVDTSSSASGGIGGPGTSFSGGPGGGGAPRGVGGNGAVDGGAGGYGLSPVLGTIRWSGGGGAGNPGGLDGGGGSPGQSGTGGLMILFVKGNIIFGPTGKIISAGSNGGAGYESGGGSGGGAIHVFHKGNISNPEKITAPGGLPGNSIPTHIYPGAPGQPGGNGSISLNQI